MATRTKNQPPPQKRCSLPDCGRPAYARGLCQTHHRHLLKTGTTKPIRPYRLRSVATVKYSGFRLTPECVAALDDFAREHNLSRGAAITDVVEQWARNRRS